MGMRLLPLLLVLLHRTQQQQTEDTGRDACSPGSNTLRGKEPGASLVEGQCFMRHPAAWPLDMAFHMPFMTSLTGLATRGAAGMVMHV